MKIAMRSTSTSTSSNRESNPTGSGSQVSAISVVSSIVVVAAAFIVTAIAATGVAATNDGSPEQSTSSSSFSSLPLFVSAETTMRRRTNALRSILLSEPVLVEDDDVDQPLGDSTITISRTDDESVDYGYKVDGQDNDEDVDLDLDLDSDLTYDYYGYADDESFREFQIRSLQGRRQMKSGDSSSSHSSPSPSSVRADMYTSMSDRFCVERCSSRSRSPSNPHRNTFSLNRWV